MTHNRFDDYYGLIELLLPSWIWILCSNAELFAKNYSPKTLSVRCPRSPKQVPKAVPMLMDKTRHKSVERLGCHNSTGQIVPSLMVRGTKEPLLYSVCGVASWNCCHALFSVALEQPEACFGWEGMLRTGCGFCIALQGGRSFSYFQAMAIEESPANERHKMYCEWFKTNHAARLWTASNMLAPFWVYGSQTGAEYSSRGQTKAL